MPNLEINLLRAEFLRDVEHLGRKQDPYAILKLGEDVRRSKTISDGGKRVAWNETFVYSNVEPGCVLKIEFYDANFLFDDQLLGRSKVHLVVLPEAVGVVSCLSGGSGRTPQPGSSPGPASPLRPASPLHPASPLRPASPARQAAPPPVKAPSRLAVKICSRKGAERGTVWLGLRWWEAGEGPEEPGGRMAGRTGPSPLRWLPRLFTRKQSEPDWWVLPAYKDTRVRDEWRLLRVLGQGGHGVTHAARHRTTGVEAAIKVIDKASLSTHGDIQNVRREVHVLHHLSDHPHIVGFKGVYEDRDTVSLAMELCSGGDMYHSIVKRQQYSEADAACVMRALMEAVAHCHSMGVVHRDIKPENIIFALPGGGGGGGAGGEEDRAGGGAGGGEGGGGGPVLKLADFGLAEFFKEGKVITEYAGTAWYAAPEVFRHCYSKEADVWSCGVVAYVLLCGYLPFAGRNTAEVHRAVEAAYVDFDKEPWLHISAEAKDCIGRMLEYEPSKRATVQQVLQHGWLRANGVAREERMPLEVLSRLKQFGAMSELKKLVWHVIVRNLPADEVQGMRELFVEIDKDQSGTIGVEELREALVKKGAHGLALGEVDKLVEEADIDGDGTLDYEDFLAATVHRYKIQREELLEQAFAHLDLDGCGHITEQELSRVLAATLGADPKEVDQVMEEFDIDKDGVINLQDFMTVMRSDVA